MEIRGAKKTIKAAKSFVDEVAAEPGGEKINECIQCGVCSGSCTTAEWWEFTPRQIIAMIRAGMKKVLASSSAFHCVSCYLALLLSQGYSRLTSCTRSKPLPKRRAIDPKQSHWHYTGLCVVPLGEGVFGTLE
jgi:ferredoxin